MPIYCGYFFEPAAVAACFPIPNGMKPVANPHVTLGFHRDFTETTLAAFVAAHYREGETREILVSGVCYNHQCVCLRVASDLHCFPEDRTLHVTLYLAKKVRPVYSNALLADPTATNITFDTPIPLTGVFRVVS